MNTRAIAWILCFGAVTAASHAQIFPGCELPAGYETAERPRPSTLPPNPALVPRLRIESLRRGFDDGNPRSCSNVGVLTLVVDPRTVTETEVYSFEVADGSVPSGLLPGGYVESVDLGSGRRGFRFYWLDLAPETGELAPLDAVISVTRTSYAGDRSTPAALDVVDPGGPPASTAWLRNSTGIWIGVTLVLLVLVGMRMKAFRRTGRRSDELGEIQARLRELAAAKEPGGRDPQSRQSE